MTVRGLRHVLAHLGDDTPVIIKIGKKTRALTTLSLVTPVDRDGQDIVVLKES